MPTLEPGRIIWAVIRDKNGYAKPNPRPAVVLLVNDAETEVLVAACTTSIPKRLPPDQLHLPWAPNRRCITQLDRRTVVVCSWTDRIAVPAIRSYGGIVDERLFRRIARLVNHYRSGEGR